MAGFDYSRMQATASRLMSRFAQGTVTLSRTVPGEPDPETPWIPGQPVTTSYELDATVAAVTVDQANAKYIDGTTITTADVVVTCAVFDVSPLASDTLSIDGVVRTIKKIVQVPAAGTPVVWKLFVQG